MANNKSANNGKSGNNAGNKNGGKGSDNTSNRGFASMDPEQQREIASEGGKAAHASGHAHEFDSEEAREAGRKGGEAVSRDKQHMSEIGRKGGESRGSNNEDDGKDTAKRSGNRTETSNR